MKNKSSLLRPLDFNPSFDGFRGLAILLVILNHSYISSSPSQLNRYWHWILALVSGNSVIGKASIPAHCSITLTVPGYIAVLLL
ncbi:MAG: hypothetical protein EXR74_02975 [Bdellovibrionales bacterium]|nr:hypothetical protein [Bdellovibrionales bacterium]